MGFWDFLSSGDAKKENGSIPPQGIESPEPSPVAPKVARSAAPPPAAPTPPPAPPATRYGIDKANELMATIDIDDDPDPVVRVIRKTLESVGVSIPELIADAKRRESDLRDNVGKRRATIADLERQIQIERNEIATLEASLARTGKTRGHLELAEQNRTQIQKAFTVDATPAVPNEAKAKPSGPPPPLPSKASSKPTDLS